MSAATKIVRVKIEQVEVYLVDVEVDADEEVDGDLAIEYLRDMDEDDEAACYQQSSYRVWNDETGEPLPVEEH